MNNRLCIFIGIFFSSLFTVQAIASEKPLWCQASACPSPMVMNSMIFNPNNYRPREKLGNEYSPISYIVSGNSEGQNWSGTLNCKKNDNNSTCFTPPDWKKQRPPTIFTSSSAAAIQFVNFPGWGSSCQCIYTINNSDYIGENGERDKFFFSAFELDVSS